MNSKRIILLLFSFLFCITLNAQLLSLGFVKNCNSYKKTAFDDELKKKHFFQMPQKPTIVSSEMLADGTYYSNEKTENRSASGEIKIISVITDQLKVTEITFFNGSKNYWKNYNDIFKQMVAFFNNQQSFKSSKYKTDVALFLKDNVFYYAYKNGEIPVIVVSNVKLEDTYFSK